MAEPAGTGASTTWLGRWRRSATFWRVAALALVGLPQLAGLPLPDLGPEPDSSAIMTSSVVISMGDQPTGQMLIAYVSGSGVLVLLLAAVFALPRRRARRVTPWAAGVLAAIGLAIGYVAMSGLGHAESANAGALGDLLFLPPLYLLAAGALVMSGRVARPAA